MKLRELRAQKCNPCFGTKTLLRSTGLQSTRYHASPYRADSANLRKFGATFRHGNVFAPKHSLYEKEATRMESPTVILVSVQKAQFAVRVSKIPGFMHRRIRPTVQICGNSGLPFAMVPCLHQSILYIKRKLRDWRVQKCNPCFGAKSLLRSTGLQSTRIHASPYRADSANLPRR